MHHCSLIRPRPDRPDLLHWPVGMRAHLLVDADNQSPHVGRCVCRFLVDQGLSIQRAVVACNDRGGSFSPSVQWMGWLRQDFRVASLESITTPIRKDAADVRLVMQIAAYVHRPPDQTLVVILSRDGLLLESARILAEQGVPVIAAMNNRPALPQDTVFPQIQVDLKKSRLEERRMRRFNSA